MKRTSSILIMAFFFFLFGCHTSKTDVQKSVDSQDYKSIAIQKYGHNIEYILNSLKTHVICLKRNKPTPQIPQHQISFFIYDLEDKQIIFEESSIDAEVKWKNDHQVQVKITPGIVSGDETPEDFTYIYDVRLGKKIK